ncbi:hypothetical protein DB88DRAFT_486016 [Papiliotrema laurentii]|uniref:Uncharacterized protein n=1 Tax=Papiliotrema laurentii TaxID=5418 RepID=A0AAD9L5P7_PAPLA|nr:hypothetical protein DB88DRAFT_486016 [Papiliotrema laurentii]
MTAGTALPSQITASPDGPLKLANQLLDMSSNLCLAPGGGCGVFNLTFEDCQDDHCACEDSATLAGMVCGQCNANQNAITLYNQYLQACQKAGWAHPSDTVTVSLGTPPVALVTPPNTTQTLTALKPSTAAAAKASSAPSLSGGHNDDDNSPGLPNTDDPDDESPSTADADSTSTDKGTSASKLRATNAALQQDDTTTARSVGPIGQQAKPTGAFALVANNSSPLSPGSPTAASSGSKSSSGLTLGSASDDSEDSPALSDSSDMVVSFSRTVMSSMILTVSTPTSHGSSLKDSSGVTAASNSTSASAKPSQPSDLALGATLRFFGFDIDGKCDDSCSVWKSLANTCKQDRCICTKAGISSAASCSQCLGSTTHGEAYQQQIGLYNAFTSNCTAYVDGPTAAAAGVGNGLSGYDIVPSATNTHASEVRSTGRPPTKANAEATATETKTMGGQRLARSASISLYAVSIMLGWLVLGL